MFYVMRLAIHGKPVDVALANEYELNSFISICEDSRGVKAWQPMGWKPEHFGWPSIESGAYNKAKITFTQEDWK